MQNSGCCLTQFQEGTRARSTVWHGRPRRACGPALPCPALPCPANKLVALGGRIDFASASPVCSGLLPMIFSEIRVRFAPISRERVVGRSLSSFNLAPVQVAKRSSALAMTMWGASTLSTSGALGIPIYTELCLTATDSMKSHCHWQSRHSHLNSWHLQSRSKDLLHILY